MTSLEQGKNEALRWINSHLSGKYNGRGELVPAVQGPTSLIANNVKLQLNFPNSMQTETFLDGLTSLSVSYCISFKVFKFRLALSTCTLCVRLDDF